LSIDESALRAFSDELLLPLVLKPLSTTVFARLTNINWNLLPGILSLYQ